MHNRSRSTGLLLPRLKNDDSGKVFRLKTQAFHDLGHTDALAYVQLLTGPFVKNDAEVALDVLIPYRGEVNPLLDGRARPRR